MNRFRLTMLSFLLAMAATAGAQETVMTVDVATAGTLPELIGDANKASIESLTVTGQLNGTDINYIREMAGRDKYGEVVKGNSLKALDLSGADIVEGGDTYFYSYGTSNDAVSDFMFAECSQLTSLVIPTSTVSLGWDAISSCTGLTEFTIPDNVTTIGEAVFEQSSNIASISMGKSVTTIEGYAFDGCSSLAEITLPESLTSLGEFAFNDCSSLSKANIPSSVATVGSYAFCGCSSLTDLTISDGVKSIGDNAFSYCSSLDNVILPESVGNISESAFYGCSSLTNIQLPSQLTVISEEMLSGCSSLRQITIPESVEEIGESAFLYDESLESITVPNAVETIGDNAFFGCTAMTEANIGSGVNYLGEDAFKNCDGLKAINVDADNASYGSIDGLLTNKEGDELIAVPGSYAADLVIPESIKTIADGACAWNVNVTSLTIHDQVESIGEDAFEACEKLTKMTLGSSVASIGEDAFFSCDALEEIHCRMATPVDIDEYMFWSVDKSACTLYVPNGSLEAYKAHEVWGEFENIQEEEVTAIRSAFNLNGEALIINGKTVGALSGEVIVSSVNGTVVYRGCDSNVSITVPGLYIVKMGNQSFKYIVQ